MSTISTMGVGSGIDIRGLVDGLLEAESTPKTAKFDTDEKDTENQLSLFGTLKSKLSEFETSLNNLSNEETFQQRKITSEDESLFKAVVYKEATPGTYNIEVEQLATADKKGSDFFVSKTSTVGTGQLSIVAQDTTTLIDITTENQTLEGVRDAINAVSSETQVTATLITVDAGVQLVLTSRLPGVSNGFSITATDNDGNNADDSGLSKLIDANMTQLVTPQNALVKIDGQQVTSPTNEVAEVIDGVIIDLIAADDGNTKQLIVEYDQLNAENQVKSFVDAYNEVIDTINEITKRTGSSLLAGSDDESTTSTNDAKNLIGDSTVRAIEYKLKTLIVSQVEGSSSFAALSEIGITSNAKTGKLEYKLDQLSDSLRADFDGVGQLFSASGTGVSIKLQDAIKLYTQGGNGLIAEREKGLQSRLDDISQKRVDFERYLQKYESRLVSQFTAMDKIVATLNQTSSFLDQQLSALPEPLSFKK